MLRIGGPLEATLRSVAVVMRSAREPWWIITGAAVALHRVDAGAVADVDVLLSVDDARRVLRSIGIEPARRPPHPDYRSDIFETWSDNPLPVEFMANFSYRVGAEWRPVHPRSREAVEIGGVTLFVPNRAELRDLLLGLGRPKDLERARGLAAGASDVVR